MIELALRVGSWARSWQVELCIAVVAAAFRQRLLDLFGIGAANLFLIGVVAAALGVPPWRRWLMQRLGARHRRRRWGWALASVIAAPATPTVTASGRGPIDDWVVVRVGPGGTVTDLAARAEALAAWMDATEVRVTRHPASAAVALLRAMRADPLARPAGPWPGTGPGSASLWHPVPIGVGEDGAPVSVTLFEHNLLVGGEPGSGKSVALSQLVAAAALDPAATLWLLDGKLVELAAWRGVAQRFAGTDIAEATDALRAVQAVMDDRYRHLLDTGQRKIPPGTGLHVVVIDELAHYSTWPDKRPRDAFSDTLRDLVSRGRAAGVVVIAATQKPGADVVPTSLRDLFGYRWALRCTTPAASDTILGTGWASQGVSAHVIAASLRGVGWLLHETGQPLRLRAHHLDDAQVAAIAAGAAQQRAGRPSGGHP